MLVVSSWQLSRIATTDFVVVWKIQNAPSKKNAEIRVCVCMIVYQKTPTLREVYGMSLFSFIRLSLGKIREEFDEVFFFKITGFSSRI